MWGFFTSLIVGLVVGYRVPLSKRVLGWAGAGTNGGLVVLLFTMGVKIGMNAEIFDNLRTIGLHAALLSVGAVTGSLVLLTIWERKFSSRSPQEVDSP
jgi:uncharacterized transporter YbjL